MAPRRRTGPSGRCASRPARRDCEACAADVLPPVPENAMNTPADTAAAKAPAAPRVDLYGPIHKGLRLLMADTLCRVGCLDVDDRDEAAATLAQVGTLLDFCRAHVAHENQFVHTAIEARQPGASSRVAGEHDDAPRRHCLARSRRRCAARLAQRRRGAPPLPAPGAVRGREPRAHERRGDPPQPGVVGGLSRRRAGGHRAAPGWPRSSRPRWPSCCAGWCRR